MKRIAQFEKVSKEQYEKDSIIEAKANADAKAIALIYEDVILPKRATAGSAGYDFFMPFHLVLNPGEEIKIATGIRVKMEEGWVLKIYPRSSLGFKYRLGLCNTVGIIDSDYYFAKNEGHIQIKIVNNGDKVIDIEKGQGFAQGIFLEYGITMDDDCEEKRIGGFGSTNK